MMTYPFVRSIKLFDYRIKLWQPRTVVARANVSSSDRTELLLSLRVRYICWQRWVGFIRCQFEHAFPSTGFAVALARPYVTFGGSGGIMTTARPELPYPCSN